MRQSSQTRPSRAFEPYPFVAARHDAMLPPMADLAQYSIEQLR